MQKHMKRFLCLLAMCLLVVGCDSDEPLAAAPDALNNAEPESPRIELVVEASVQSITNEGIPRDATAILRDILNDDASLPPAGFTLRIDEAFVRSNQLLFIIEPDGVTGVDDDALEAAATTSFDQLKASFESYAEAAVRDELASYTSQIDQARSEVKALQKALQFYQETLRGSPETDASRLERRKHKLAIDNALKEQVSAEKQVESLQRQIDRGQFATLERVR